MADFPFADELLNDYFLKDCFLCINSMYINKKIIVNYGGEGLLGNSTTLVCDELVITLSTQKLSMKTLSMKTLSMKTYA